MSEASVEIGAGPAVPLFELPDVEAEWVYLVDDDAAVLATVERLLVASGYRVRAFLDPAEALASVEPGLPRVMISDMEMVGMTGLDLASKVLEIDPAVRVIMVTGAGDEETAQATLRLGFTDYLRKPVDHRELTAAVQKAFLSIARDEYAEEMDEWLRAEVRRQTQTVHDVTLGTLEALLNALEARSAHFKGHSQSVAVCAAGIARELGVPEPMVRSIRVAGLLHDIGMIAVADHVVEKPSELTPEEYRALQLHCQRGADILQPLERLDRTARYVLEHHERYDGSGYPLGIEGDAISTGGQIVGLAEAWTAALEERPYRPAASVQEALEGLRAAGRFRSDLLDVLQSVVSAPE